MSKPASRKYPNSLTGFVLFVKVLENSTWKISWTFPSSQSFPQVVTCLRLSSGCRALLFERDVDDAGFVHALQDEGGVKFILLGGVVTGVVVDT